VAIVGFPAGSLTDGDPYYTTSNTTLNTATGNGYVLCVIPGAIAAADREEGAVRGGFVISPGTATTVNLCGETSVLSFNAPNGASSVLGGVLNRNDIAPGFADGWLNIGTSSATAFAYHVEDFSQGVNGLPVIGYAAVSAGGQLAATWPHRTSGF
jgi:hypothetical protein